MSEMETLRKLAHGQEVSPGDRLMACAWAVRRISELESLLTAGPEVVEPVRAQAQKLLTDLASRVLRALDDSEELDGDDGRVHVLDGQHFDDLSEVLDAMEALPDPPDEGVVYSGPMKAAYYTNPSAMPEGFSQGVRAASALIREKVQDYDNDHGSTDPETGTREYPGDGSQWVLDMCELADEIDALLAAPFAPAQQAVQEKQRNQCDGCQAGIPVDERGFHRMGKPGGYSDPMSCTAHLYGHGPEKQGGGEG